jgi:hypothetical protein
VQFATELCLVSYTIALMKKWKSSEVGSRIVRLVCIATVCAQMTSAGRGGTLALRRCKTHRLLLKCSLPLGTCHGTITGRRALVGVLPSTTARHPQHICTAGLDPIAECSGVTVASRAVGCRESVVIQAWMAALRGWIFGALMMMITRHIDDRTLQVNI